MAGLDDVFGKRPLRPDHADFWRISEVILAADGAIQDATTDDEREAAWAARTDAVVDRASVSYAAVQRAQMAFGGDLVAQTKGAALWVEAFVFGAMYAQRGGHQGD